MTAELETPPSTSALPERLAKALRTIVGESSLLTDPAETAVYETDGFTLAKGRPAAVALCSSAEHVSQVVKLAADEGLDVIPRGSGTGLTGGCVAGSGKPAVVVCVSRMRRIRSIDVLGRVACVEAGVRNLALSEVVAQAEGGAHLHFAPDPSSQRASTIAGNAATNAGGLHTLKDFVTASHVLGLEVVTGSGEIIHIGAADGTHAAPGGFDLAGLFCGSEGTLGLITAVWVRLVPKRPSFRTVVATFPSQEHACHAVSNVIAAGHLPAAMEMLDGRMVKLVNDVFKLGIDERAEAMLLCEIDGPEATLDDEAAEISELFNAQSAISIESAKSIERKNELWQARRKAFAAIGRISQSYCTQDACVPRSKLAEVLKRVDDIGKQHGLTINNVFHAGDGNVHPVFLYDDRDPKQVANILEAAEKVLQLCIDLGGTATGEHGVGLEKIHLMPYLFDAATLAAFDKVKQSFDPHAIFNEGKMLPRGDSIRPASPGRKVPQ